MKLELDKALVEAVTTGRAVLFLGAGASLGATRENGAKIPLASELGARIASEFLGAGYEQADFKTICDFSASERSGRELQQFIHKELIGFRPAPFHHLIPRLAWAGIATTNYDLIIEEAYKNTPDRIQELIPNCKDGDGAAERLGSNGLLYVKLHGCITHYQETHPPLVASTEQIINHKEGRAGQFAQFLEWAKTKTIIFAGYGLSDSNLRTLFEEIRRDGDNHPRHYIVRPGIKGPEANYWRERRVQAVDATFQTFLEALDSAIQLTTRKLALHPTISSPTTFTRFISKAGVSESPSLIRFLESQCEHVSELTNAQGGTAKQFFRGFDLGWYPVSEGLDVRRRITQAVLDECVISTQHSPEAQLFVVKGHAGGGKSIILRRVAWDAARVYGRLVFWLQNGSGLNVDAFEEIVGLTNQTIYIVVDDLAEDVESTAYFIRHAKRHKWRVAIIGGARVNEWNVRCEDLEPLVNEEYELNYLSTTEIEELLRLLEKHDCLGHLQSLPREERSKKLKEVYGRQLLVALHEATENASFRDIVSNEFGRVFPVEARLLYLDICSLNRFGPPVRAGLIARVHGIDFDEFSERFFKPLEQVISLTRDSTTQDWVYKARHPVIAQLVYETALPSVRDKFDNIMRIIGKLNPGYSYDREVLSELIRAGKLVDIFKDRTMGNSIYDAALTTIGQDSFIYHQRGIYEMRLAGDNSSLDRAEQLFAVALELAPGNPTIKHSLSELSLRRSALGKDDVEREAWRRRSEVQALELVRNSRSSHPQHTLAKVAVARVKDALEKTEAEDSPLSQEALSQAIKHAEDVLREGLQRYPNDDRLLTEEAHLSEVLQNAERALKALDKAFRANSKSELIARRLSRILRAKGLHADSIHVLRQSLEQNQGSQVLHYDLARTIIESAPNADIGQADQVLYHLQRSYSPGDKNYEARFWYARQLCLCGRARDATPIFAALKKLQIPLSQRQGVRGIVKTESGEPALYYGQIYAKKPLFAFCRADHDDLEAFVAADQVEGGLDALRVGQRVEYNLGFTLRGPNALSVKKVG